jgi:hypothetical protein
LRRHFRFVERNSRKLARCLFHAMVRRGPKLEREQLLLGRFVDIAAELFAMAASCARANREEESSVALADCFCRMSRLRLAQLFRETDQNEDRQGYRLAQQLLKGVPPSLATVPLQRAASTGPATVRPTA